MLGKRLVDLGGIGDALQRCLTVAGGGALLKSAQLGDKIGSGGKEGEQEQKGYEHAATCIRVRRHLRSAPIKLPFFLPSSRRFGDDRRRVAAHKSCSGTGPRWCPA